MTILSEAQIGEFKEIFDRCDKSKDNVLQKDEVKAFLTAVGLLDEKDSVDGKEEVENILDVILAKLDVDLSETISFEEFIAFISTRPDMLNERIVTVVFNIIDVNNDGSISVDEFKHSLEALNADLSPAEIQRVFQQADKDLNGQVDRQEFKQVVCHPENGVNLWKQIGQSIYSAVAIKEVFSQYARLAQHPEWGFGTLSSLPYGKSNAKMLGYNVGEFPDEVWESSCMCFNPFSLLDNPEEQLRGKTVVDFGCGAGADLIVSAGFGAAHSVGVDMNKPMVVKANQVIEAVGMSQKVEVHVGIFDKSSLPPGLYPGMADYAIINGTLNLSTRKPCALKCIFATLKPGGIFLLGDVYLEDGDEPSKKSGGAWCDCIAGAVTRPKLEELLGNAGFIEVKYRGDSYYKTSDATPVCQYVAKKPMTGLSTFM